MTDIEKMMLSEVELFISFCKKHEQIYLYGAGKIGRKYLDILKWMGRLPDGFIVSGDSCGEVDGIKVFTASEIKNRMSSTVGVIATFKGADENILRSALGEIPDVYIPGDDLRTMLEWEYVFFAFLKKQGCIASDLKSEREWSNILIIRLDVLGDAIMSTAFIRELRRNCPNSHITLVVNPVNELLFQNCPYVTELCLYDFEKQVKEHEMSVYSLQHKWEHVEKFASNFLPRHYDIVFQLCPLLGGRSALEALMLGCAVKADCQVGRVYSWKKNKDRDTYLYDRFSQLFSYISYDEMPKHEVACLLDMLSRCGGIVDNERLELWFDKNATMDKLLLNKFGIDSKQTWIAVGIVGRLPSQCWPADRYGRFFEEFVKKHNVGFIMFGGSDAQETAEKIKNNLSNTSNMVIDLTGQTTLKQAISVMRNCVAYVGANTGLMHMAAALGKPVVEISFYVKSEDGQENSPMGPWGTKSIVLQKHGMDGCSEICSKPFSHCITQISVQEVVEATEQILDYK